MDHLWRNKESSVGIEGKKRLLCNSTEDAIISTSLTSQVPNLPLPPNSCSVEERVPTDNDESRRDMCYEALNERVVPH